VGPAGTERIAQGEDARPAAIPGAGESVSQSSGQLTCEQIVALLEKLRDPSLARQLNKSLGPLVPYHGCHKF
jgi:hypothetical protein